MLRALQLSFFDGLLLIWSVEISAGTLPFGIGSAWEKRGVVLNLSKFYKVLTIVTLLIRSYSGQ